MARLRTVLLAASCISFLTSATFHASGASFTDDRSVYQKAMDSAAAMRFEAASRYLENFIESSVGDDRLDKAQKELHEARTLLAKQWASEGREADAAAIDLKLADDPQTPADAKDGLKKQAAQLVTAAVSEARNKHLFTRALELNKQWLKLFPDKAALLTQEEVETLTGDAFMEACQDKISLLAFPDLVKQYYPDGNVPWDELAKKNHNQPVQAGYYRALSDIGWAGRFLAEYQKLPADGPLKSNAALAEFNIKMLMARAQAWAAQGNLAAADEAAGLAKAGVASETDGATIKALQARLAAHMATDPRELSFPGPITGKVSWQDQGSGFQNAKDVELGEGADVIVKAGFVLDGGRIELHRAHLRLMGTPAQPVIFRNVSLDVQLGGELDAEDAIFINCTFSKTGEFYNYYSSKWSIASSILYRTRFSNMNPIDYGVKITNTACVECPFSSRMVMGSDLGGFYKDRWSHIANCFFYRGSLYPSTVWMTSECNFVQCPITRENQFDSRTSLLVPLFTPATDPMRTELVTQTVVADKGDLRYGFNRKPYDMALPGSFWALLPVEGSDIPKPKKQPKPATDSAGAKSPQRGTGPQ
jgi:hypothetical protein